VVRLGQAEGGFLLAVREGGQVLLLLLVVSSEDDRPGGEAGAYTAAASMYWIKISVTVALARASL
jgi:hypothetical protein